MAAPKGATHLIMPPSLATSWATVISRNKALLVALHQSTGNCDVPHAHAMGIIPAAFEYIPAAFGYIPAALTLLY